MQSWWIKSLAVWLNSIFINGSPLLPGGKVVPKFQPSEQAVGLAGDQLPSWNYLEATTCHRENNEDTPSILEILRDFEAPFQELWTEIRSILCFSHSREK